MTTMVVALAVTVVALGAVLWSGVTRRRTLHYALVVGTLAALAWAIYEAEAVGRGLRFEGAAHVVKLVHFVGVGLTFAMVPAMLVSGVRLHRKDDPPRRGVHGALAKAFLVVVLVTCALGTAMTMLAEPLGAPGN